MAIDAALMFHAVECVAPGRRMTLRAFHGGMFAHEGVDRFLMAADSEGGGLEALLDVAGGAILFGELGFVRVVFGVAIRAQSVLHGFLEVG